MGSLMDDAYLVRVVHIVSEDIRRRGLADGDDTLGHRRAPACAPGEVLALAKRVTVRKRMKSQIMNRDYRRWKSSWKQRVGNYVAGNEQYIRFVDHHLGTKRPVSPHAACGKRAYFDVRFGVFCHTG